MPDNTTLHPLRQLLLRSRHELAGAKFAPFAGWEMPLQYAGIPSEHAAVRTHAGVFDVSHMGRVRVQGPDAARAIRSVSTWDATQLAAGASHYSLYCNEDGGIADDLLVYRMNDDRWLLVHNAANAAPDYARLRPVTATAEDVTDATVMLAVQGPAALGILSTMLESDLEALPAHSCTLVRRPNGAVFVGRTGYTGEDGAECVTDAATGAWLWDALLAAGVTPCGLGARDTLRLEASLPLHGHEITSATHPYEAGLGWTVTLDDGAAFTGREALARLRKTPAARRLVSLRCAERAVLRAGYAVRDPASGAQLGTLTSGAFSPTLRVGIGMAYLPAARRAADTVLAVEVRQRRIPITVVRRPIYRRRS